MLAEATDKLEMVQVSEHDQTVTLKVIYLSL